MALSVKFNKPNVADNIRSLVSKTVKGANGNADYIVLDIPRNALLTVKSVEVITAFTASSTGTLTVGYKLPGAAIVADGFADDTVTLSEATGIKMINKTRHFPNGGVLTIGVTKGTSVADIVARLTAEYSIVCA